MEACSLPPDVCKSVLELVKLLDIPVLLSIWAKRQVCVIDLDGCNYRYEYRRYDFSLSRSSEFDI